MPADLRALVDPDAGLVSAEVYADQEIFDLEMDRVFGRCWLFLVHEAQLKRPGDFFSTYMGLDPVIVVRQRDGSLAAFLNACRHRGMRVCRDDSGSTRAFNCPYHGWTYGIDGALLNVPFEEAYGGALDKDASGLVQVPRLETYKGLVFATFDEDAPPLVEYLGDMAYYLDASFDRLEGGVEVIGGLHKWRVRCNWKFAAEQFAADMYHVYTSHLSPYTVIPQDLSPDVADPLGTEAEVNGNQFSSPYGHGAGWWLSDDSGIGDAAIQPPIVRDYLQRVRADVAARLGDTRARMEMHNTVFPNFSLLYAGLPTMRVWHPKEPGVMEVWSWAFVDASAPPEVKAAMRRFITVTFGPSGIVEQDDGNNWATIQENLAAPRVRRSALNFQLGMGMEGEDPELPGRIGPVLGEMASRGFFRRWLDLMEGAAWPVTR